MLGDNPAFECVVPRVKVDQPIHQRVIYSGMFWSRILDNQALPLESANDLLIAYQSVYSLNCLGLLSTGLDSVTTTDMKRLEVKFAVVPFCQRHCCQVQYVEEFTKCSRSIFTPSALYICIKYCANCFHVRVLWKT